MKTVRLNNLNLKLITIYLVVAAIIIDATSMYRYLTNSPLFDKGFRLPLSMICLLYVLQSKSFKVNNAIRIRLPIVMIVLFIYAYVTRSTSDRFLVSYVGAFFFLFVFAYALYQNHQMKEFMRAFSNVIIIMAVVSLFFWLFGSILHVLPGRSQLTYYWAESYRTTYTYYYLYFENPIQNIGHGTICNLGVFTEAPGYSGFLTYALLIELVFRQSIIGKKNRRKSLFRILILIITELTTDSTKGIIAVLIALTIEYVAKETHNNWRKALKAIVGVAVIVIVAYIGFVLIGNKLETSSGMYRLDDLRSGFKTFLQHPMFGAGYNNVEAVMRNQLHARSNQGLSMGLTVLLAYGGLWLSAIYAGAVAASYKIPYFRRNRRTWILIVCVLFYNLFVSNSAFSSTYIFLIAAAYAAPMREVKSLQTKRVHIKNAAQS